MNHVNLPYDPYNIIITGVGGQGNVMASRVVGNMLSRRGLQVTIGETFGASQRGGSVMSHLRISSGSSWSPQIPKGRCHLVISLEPTEAMRVLATYGNPNVKVLCNTRPVHAIGVISGDQAVSRASRYQILGSRTVGSLLVFGGHRKSHGIGQSDSRQYHDDRSGCRYRCSAAGKK